MPEPIDTPLWSPSPERVAATQVTAFRRQAEERHKLTLPDYRALHAWSVRDPAAFWDLLWDVCGVIGEKGSRRAVDLDRMPGGRFFPDARLNFAENLLRGGAGEAIAMVFQGEDKASLRLTWQELFDLVSRLQQAMRAAGVGVGDRVAAMMPNRPETIAVMLAAASIGAIFSSCSPDFGERGVLDRFGQIEPKLVFAVDGYWYAGKRIAIRDKLAAIAPQLPSAVRTVIVPYLGEAEAVAAALPNGITLEGFLAPFAPAPLGFERLAFDHPLYILYSSGTTGVPKCIVHGAGGTLLQHLKEHRLQSDIRPGDAVFYFTTCGWMMWNWLASALASGAKLVLFDGSPFHPEASVLFDLAEREGVTLFGTSAKYIDAAHKAGLTPASTHDLSALRLMTSTGSPLSPDGFAWVYRKVKQDLHLASISGGTDIVSCFVLGDPTSPVWPGEIQAAGLGMAVDVWNDDGKPVRQEKGELVCTRPFPSMPVRFWNDPDDKKYHAAYFERFDNIWHHGDFAEWTAHGGLIIHGRSDATLNPGGVRIGTAELYAQVEKIPEVLESLAIGQDFDNDVRIVLFVRLREGLTLDDALVGRIRTQVRTGASPRHVPAKILQVADIPHTKSGKITELAVRDVVAGRTVKNKEALANPEALELYKDLPELRS
ncbi:acetoacetate--CoA ligase [Labrys wisconsinensis]|uniref:Acetoacetyl-CoA synthetase n=1 Tax=Labrys wisconsinensis TaxID=425677 RepID=A0ABU0JED4_9HYPH|nr:acetoacetate--CoA ligase [Labrys wisconsinensis]MDQ0472626.1 acetoacetyl-CoA synthetase [Labrys wisconsinensis]